MKQTILERINAIVSQENGKKVGINDTLKASKMDPIGMTVLLMTLDMEYQLVKNGTPINTDEIDTRRITIRELINLCRSTPASEPH